MPWHTERGAAQVEMSEFQILKNVMYVDKVYSGIAEIRRRMNESRLSEVDLRLSELRVFSQNGEDGILLEILRNIEVENPFFVEFGVGDGWSCNTRILAEVFGWHGLYIEVDQDNFEQLRVRYSNLERISTVCDAVQPSNINSIFRNAEVPKKFGVLSIDIDGQDYWVWQALGTEFEPDVVIVEVNLNFGFENAVSEAQGVQQGSLTETFGASVRAMQKLGSQKGYELVHIDMAGVNAFFVNKDHLHNVQFKGLTDRSPNYGLAGRFHDVDRLYKDGAISPRPVVEV